MQRALELFDEAAELSRLGTPTQAAELDDGMGDDAPPYPPGLKPSEQGLTVEAHSNILALAKQAMAAQETAMGLLQEGEQPDALQEQRRSHELLKKIEEHLAPRG